MTFKFNIRKKDFYNVRAYEFSSTKSFRVLVLVERLAGIIVLGVAAYVLKNYIDNVILLFLFIAACLVWVIGFPWIMNVRFRAHAKKEIAESGERVREGEVQVTFGENVIEQRSPGNVVRRIIYKRVIWVEDAVKYVLIYDDANPTPIIIPSDEIFESKEERQKFVKDLRDDCNIKVEDRRKALGKSPKLKVHR